MGNQSEAGPSSQGSSALADLASPSKPSFPRQRSRGQLARRNSITRGSDAVKEKRRHGKKRANAMKDARHPTSPASIGRDSKEERPWLGGLFFTDLVFIAFTYTINLLRTCGLAELADVFLKGLAFFVTRLPYEFYRRWTLSTPPSSTSPKRNNTSKRKSLRRRRTLSKVTKSGSSSESDTQDVNHQPLAFTSSLEPEPDFHLAHSPDQLSPFHHIVILLSRFACSNFPHLLPRVLFAEETIGPFVYWRTGGGSNAMVQEFTDLQDRQRPIISSGEKTSGPTAKGLDLQEPKFRAYLLSKDARLPIEVQRSNLASRSATTLLYLHGGGFSLGSVAFYAEALLRLRAKICALEALDGNEDNVAEARCVAVEYDLSPAARFPTPLLQCLRCYAHLIEVEKVDPNSICIGGDSAGGNLAMGLLLCLDGQMKDETMLSERDWSKLPKPGKAMLISPWVDLRPSSAHAFSMLRSPREDEARRESDQDESNAERKPSKGWVDAVAAYEWDYVASEALLHFAQVYAGVLPSPRRVRGPLGWIAHICGVVAKEYGEQDKTSSMNGYMDPLGALSALARPSKRLAQATHDMLSDPFFSKILGLKDVNILSEDDRSQAIALPNSTNASSFEPLFTASDRKTETVASTKNLYHPFEHNRTSTVDRIGMDKGTAEQERLKAEMLLESHPLLSPAIGDWRSINLKGGMLVTWGERERMAEDIEAWIDGVYQEAAENDKDVPPAQDGESQPKQSRKSLEEEQDALWIETAVERGPGGVHAWPFVSMYLAGSEAERERGLDLLADFIARSPSETVTLGNQGIDDQAVQSIDPPHAAPDSPVSETASVGSMPSDVDLHGLIEEEYHDDMPSPAPVLDMDEAIRKANELALSKVSSEIRRGVGASKATTPAIKQATTSSPIQQQKMKATQTAIPARVLGAQSQRIVLPRIATERERGRSRSPRRTEGLSRKLTPSSDETPFVSSVQLHRPDVVPNRTSVSSSPSQRADVAAQSVTPLWWVAPTSKDTNVGPSRKDATGQTVENIGPPRPAQDLEDIMEVSSDEAFSPNRSTSPPNQDEERDEEQEAMRALSSAPLDISHFGLSHYTIRRPEPEGLSDIAEEGSVMSASVTSAGGIASRSLSPEGNFGDESSQTSLMAASKMLQEQDCNDRGHRPRWPVEEEEDDNEGLGEREKEDLAFSPPAQPQPGPSIPLVERQKNAKSFDDVSSSSPSGSLSEDVTRKKPKGDVWW